ncbi:hypothetical protein [Methylophaga sp.]|uniref:hypothetical protein n=1 Tax=Methylophaga sp. TaxID=2024840 RepID=UPI003F729141
MKLDEKIWGIAKWRFLQSEASRWLVNNKALEIVFFVGLSVWAYFEFFSSGNYSNIKYLGLILAVSAFVVMRTRYSSYTGFFDGYECGFKDASARNLDYWGKTHNETSDSIIIEAVLRDIEINESKISDENKISRDTEVKKGFSKLVGFFLTWKKLQ